MKTQEFMNDDHTDDDDDSANQYTTAIILLSYKSKLKYIPQSYQALKPYEGCYFAPFIFA